MKPKTGDRYRVLNQTFSGEVIEEGVATVVRSLPEIIRGDPDFGRALVLFDGEDEEPVERNLVATNRLPKAKAAR